MEAFLVVPLVIILVTAVHWRARLAKLSFIRHLKFKWELRKKCLKAERCQDCAYWNTRREFCALESQLRDKHKIFD